MKFRFFRIRPILYRIWNIVIYVAQIRRRIGDVAPNSDCIAETNTFRMGESNMYALV